MNLLSEFELGFKDFVERTRHFISLDPETGEHSPGRRFYAFWNAYSFLKDMIEYLPRPNNFDWPIVDTCGESIDFLWVSPGRLLLSFGNTSFLSLQGKYTNDALNYKEEFEIKEGADWAYLSRRLAWLWSLDESV